MTTETIPGVVWTADFDDVVSFKKIQKEEMAIFLERRCMYGNHLENAKRFPKEHEVGLYLKCVRFIRMFENGEEIERDTLLDMSIYDKLILSARDTEEDKECTGG